MLSSVAANTATGKTPKAEGKGGGKEGDGSGGEQGGGHQWHR